MKNIKIIFDVNSSDIITTFVFPEIIDKEEKSVLSEKTASFLSSLQTGGMMTSIIHGVVEGGIISDDKSLSDLIIKKMLSNFLVTSDEKPLVLPSEAFVFKEK
jgi:hypothetical protein